MSRKNMGDVMATRVLSEIPKESYDPNMQLSSGFTLADLTVTNTGINNMPENSQILQNLYELADLLEWIRFNIGDFVVHSAYRNSEVNSKVGGSATSLHSTGKAADIEPKTMSLTEMFGRLIQPDVAQKFGEIAIKASQGTLHISTPDPKVGTGKIMRMTDGKYYRLTQSEIDSYSQGGTPMEIADSSLEELSDDTIQDVRTASFPWWAAIAVLTSLGLLYFKIEQ